MKINIVLSLVTIVMFLTNSAYSQKQAIIIDHTCCNLQKVPDNWVTMSKNNLRIAYGHTSHGSQIVTGMEFLRSKANSIYSYNNGANSLYLNDASLLTGDLGAPDRTTWSAVTKKLLMNNTSNINMIMWSWCGQVDGSESDINTYLTQMSQLEKDYPNINFVYMTGHLNGTGINGNVHIRNEQIRKYCRNNGKVLFDFADIESYDPDGQWFLEKKADDGCNYTGGNWAVEWCAKNPGICVNSCSCAHSHCLNCQQKGKAFWWMLARISGWEGEVTGNNDDKNIFSSEIEILPNPASDNIQISCPEGYHTINIFNSLGNEIIEIDGYENTQTISTSELSAGIYYCVLSNATKRITRNFVVVR